MKILKSASSLILITLLFSCSVIEKRYSVRDLEDEIRATKMRDNEPNSYKFKGNGNNKLLFLIGSNRTVFWTGPPLLPIVPVRFGSAATLSVHIQITSETMPDNLNEVIQCVQFFQEDSVNIRNKNIQVSLPCNTNTTGSSFVYGFRYDIDVNAGQKISVHFCNELVEKYFIKTPKINFLVDYSFTYIPVLISGH